MNDYISLRVEVGGECTADYTDLLAAYLADAGYETFEPDETGITAYVRAETFDEQVAQNIVAEMPIHLDATLSHTFVKGRDWNEEWEKNYFQPIVVGDKCVIHSTFHKDVPTAEYDIVIDPKMAFGTGHHFTTRLILGYLLDADLEGKSLIDVGTGTGILAILAKMRGAARVDAIEIDPPAYENACEHTRLNNADVNVILGDASALAPLQPADFLVANINRNVILADLPKYASRLKRDGFMILSGFYEDDVPILEDAAAPLGLRMESKRVENRWTAIMLTFISDPSELM
ncbi:MAG: 50S ribosomal protein L11 methyltransferase [Muribaculaceae bacterium]|nr:50S ribosomal protein L11 methyltransferase [Muribaculaceae bacterium]